MSCWMTSGASRLRMKRQSQQGAKTRNSRKLSGGFEREAQAKASMLQLSPQQQQQQLKEEVDRGKRQHQQQQMQQRGRRTSYRSSQVIQVQHQRQSLVKPNYQPLQQQQQSRVEFEHFDCIGLMTSPSSGYSYHVAAPQITSLRPNSIHFDCIGDDNNSSSRLPLAEDENDMFLLQTAQQIGHGYSSLAKGDVEQAAPLMHRRSPSEHGSDDQDVSAFFGDNSSIDFSNETQKQQQHQCLPWLHNSQRQVLSSRNAEKDQESNNNDDEDFLVFRMKEDNDPPRVPLQSISNIKRFLPRRRRQPDLKSSTAAACHEDSATNQPPPSEHLVINNVINTNPHFVRKRHRGQIVRFFDNGVEVNPGKIKQSSAASLPEERHRKEAHCNKKNPHAPLHQIMGECALVVGRPYETLEFEFGLTSTGATSMTNISPGENKSWLKASSLNGYDEECEINVECTDKHVCEQQNNSITSQSEQPWNLFGAKVKQVDLHT